MPTFTVEYVNDATEEYAYTRAIDPNTGGQIMRGPTWLGGVPMVQVVIRVLRLVKGTYAPDKDLGLDYSVLDKMTTASRAKIIAEITRTLKFLVNGGQIQQLIVGAEVRNVKGTAAAFADVSFYDPRSRRSVRVKGTF